MKKVIFFSFLFCATDFVNGQKLVERKLYFSDNQRILTCGNLTNVQVFTFYKSLKDLNKRRTSFYIAIICPDFYGDHFLQSKKVYKLKLSKNFKKVKSYLIPTHFKNFLSTNNFFVCEAISRLEYSTN